MSAGDLMAGRMTTSHAMANSVMAHHMMAHRVRESLGPRVAPAGVLVGIRLAEIGSIRLR